MAVKTEEQGGATACAKLVKFRTRSACAACWPNGEVMPKGRAGLIPGALERVSVPAMVVGSLRDQWARVLRTDEESGSLSDGCCCGTAPARPAGGWRRSPAWACSRPLRRWPPWAIRKRSGQGASSPPGWAWSRATSAPAGAFGYWASANGATVILVDARAPRSLIGVAVAVERRPRNVASVAGEQERAHDVGAARSRAVLRTQFQEPARLTSGRLDHRYHQAKGGDARKVAGTTRGDGPGKTAIRLTCGSQGIEPSRRMRRGSAESRGHHQQAGYRTAT